MYNKYMYLAAYKSYLGKVQADGVIFQIMTQ